MIKLINTDTVSEGRGRFKDADWLTEPLDLIIGGAGGIGSWVSLFLSRIGHTLHIYDMDYFEIHNMSGQFVANNEIGNNKAESIKNMCEKFNQSESLGIYTYGEFKEDSGANNIMIACFDNMKARKLMYNKWVTFLKENPDKRKDSLFIDGRLLSEQYQIFTIQGSNFKQVKKYYEYLFDDSEADEGSCTFKQTSHVAAMIGSNMVSTFNNWITNRVNDAEIRTVPFYQEYFTPIMYSEKIMI